MLKSHIVMIGDIVEAVIMSINKLELASEYN